MKKTAYIVCVLLVSIAMAALTIYFISIRGNDVTSASIITAEIGIVAGLLIGNVL